MMPLIELIADPRTALIEGARVRLTDEQARAILALTLSRLTGLGRDEIFAEAQELADDDPRPARPAVARATRSWPWCAPSWSEVKAQFAVPRRSIIVEGDADLEDEDLIVREDMVITVTHGGYVKRTPLNTFRTAAPRRQGPLRHVDQGRGRGHPRLLRLDPHADAVLLVGRQGLQAEGLAPADRRADRARQGLHQPLPDRAGRDA